MAGAGAATQAVLLAAAVLLGMDLLSAVVPPLPAPAPSSVSASAAAAGAKPSPPPPPTKNNLPPGLHVRLCTACSYKGYYNQLATQLQQRYLDAGGDPSLFRASFSTFPPSLPRRAATAAATLGQAAALGVTLAGDKVLPALGVDPLPGWYEQHVKPRRTTCALAAWFFPNLLRQAAEATGAFEVHWDGEPIFSKLQLGRFPTVEELAVAVDKRIGSSGGGAAGL